MSRLEARDRIHFHFISGTNVRPVLRIFLHVTPLFRGRPSGDLAFRHTRVHEFGMPGTNARGPVVVTIASEGISNEASLTSCLGWPSLGGDGEGAPSISKHQQLTEVQRAMRHQNRRASA